MLIKRGTRVDIELSLLVPVDVELDKFKDWIHFELGYTGNMQTKGNPLTDRDFNTYVTEVNISNIEDEVNEDDLEELKEMEP